MKQYISLIGWYGVLAILVAYALLSFNLIGAHGYTYQVLNLTGALGLVIEAASKKDYQPTALNIVWALVAIIAIIKIFVS